MQALTLSGMAYRITRLLVALLVVVLAPRLASAQNTGDLEPEVTGIGKKMSIAGLRYIDIHRQSRNQNEPGPIVHYFHKPLFILKTAATPYRRLPKIVITQPRVIG